MGKLRVVVVEDEVFIRLDLMAHLRTAGHEVVGTAASGVGAVHAVEQQRPDLVLMDIRLAGDQDGIATAVDIWQRFGIRSLFVSANLDAGVRIQAAAANPIGFLEKPFTSESLAAALDRAI